jgi:hypothetical protein
MFTTGRNSLHYSHLLKVRYYDSMYKTLSSHFENIGKLETEKKHQTKTPGLENTSVLVE